MLTRAYNLKCLIKSLTIPSMRLSTKTSDLFDNKLKQLKDENVTEPENSLELIFAHVLNKKSLKEVRGESLKKLELTNEQVEDIEEKVRLRLSRMPVQYILGSWEFRDLLLKMKIPTFIVRPETEEMIELISQQIDKTKSYDVLEIGVGSGAISLALLNELPNIREIIAIDQSRAACELSKENAKNLNLSDRLKVFQHKLESDTLPNEIALHNFDIIVSNPPYIPSKDLLKLEPEIYL